MPTVSGKSEVNAFISRVPEAMRPVLVAAARRAAKVVAEEAKVRSISDEVSGAIRVSASGKGGQIIAKVQVRGPGAFKAPWLEYGTAPHFISVDESVRGGRSIGRINRQANELDASHSLVIGGQFVGSTVLHPGARPFPFLRPALDAKEGEAIAEAQRYINTRVTPQGIRAPDEGDDA